MKEIDIGQNENDIEIESDIKLQEKRWNQSEPKAPNDEIEKINNPPGFGVSAMENEEYLKNDKFLDPKLVPTSTEKLERIKINKEINSLIEKAIQHDKKQHENGDLRSNLAGEIIKLLTDLKYDYLQLLRLTNKLSTPNMEQIKVQLAKRKYVMEQPGLEVFLEDACVPIQKTSDSLALRRMLNIIYGRHIYPKYGIKYLSGPICRPEDSPPTIEELYTNNTEGW